MDWASIATITPGAASWIGFQVPVAGEYTIYVATWHDGAYEHLIDFQIGTGESSLTAQLTLRAGTYWQVERLGSFSLPEGEMSLRFASNPQNHPDVPVAIAAMFIIPEGRVVRELPFLREREKGRFRIDGLKEEWEDVPVFLTDPEGDQSLNSDIKELKIAIEDGVLYIMVDFYSLAEHPSFLLEIDLDGNHEPEYMIEGGTETRWVIISYPLTWLRSEECISAAFEVIELSILLSLPDPSTWTQYPPDTMPPDFNVEEVSGFYLRYRLIRSVEPIEVLDETGWGHVRAPIF
jgi:hypothetical protein